MNKLKLFAVFAVGLTIGEFLNEFRQQTTPTTLKQFTKKYVNDNVEGFRLANRAGNLLWEDPQKARELTKTIMFPNRKS